MISDDIIKRLKERNLSFNCNDNISSVLNENDLNLLIDEIELKIKDVMKSLVIDMDNCVNSKDTPRRVAKMYINEIFNGRYVKAPKITEFSIQYDELYCVGPISIRSTCGHHHQPIVGKCWIGAYPGNNLIGLSKFHRTIYWLAARPNTQEQLATEIANEIEKITNAKGVGVILRASHGCVTCRGVKEENSDMITSVMRGFLRTNKTLKKEFIDLISNTKSYREF